MGKKSKKAPVKTIYYRDASNDDFAVTKDVEKKVIDSKFNYLRLDNFFIRIWANFLYYIVAKPIIWLLLKVLFHYKVINKKVMKLRGKNGCFIYGNHTNYLPDAGFNSFLHHRRNYIIVGPQTFAIPGVGGLVQDLGAIPLGTTVEAKMNFRDSINRKLKENASVTIYPEAHIWPYYNSVRPFSDASMVYPVVANVPCFTTTTCYQKRRFGKRPKIVFVIDGPFLPSQDPYLDKHEKMALLRDQVFNAILTATKKYSTYEYYRYIKEE